MSDKPYSDLESAEDIYNAFCSNFPAFGCFLQLYAVETSDGNLTWIPVDNQCNPLNGEQISSVIAALDYFNKQSPEINEWLHEKLISEFGSCLGAEPYTKQTKKKRKDQRPGHIYLVKMGTYYKIGMTRHDPYLRAKQIFSTLPPVKPVLLAYFDSDTPDVEEEKWHLAFGDKRLHGEWFELTSEDVQAFCNKANHVVNKTIDV